MIIKSIMIKDKVIITNSMLEKEEHKALSKILEKQGKKELIKEILFLFWKCDFEGKNTIYGKFFETYKSDFTKENTKKEIKREKKYARISTLYTFDQLKDDLFVKFKEYKKKTKREKLYYAIVDGKYVSIRTSRCISLSSSIKDARTFSLAQIDNLRQRTLYKIETQEFIK